MGELKETELGPLPDDWTICSVQDLLDAQIIEKPMDGNHGNIHPKGDDFVEAGIPFIMASDISEGKINLEGCKFITKEQAASLQKGHSVTGDVLLTHKATLGRTAIVPNLEDDYIMLTPQVTYYRVSDDKKLSRKFLKYFFDSPKFQDCLCNHGDAGSTRAYVGITAQRQLPIATPSTKAEQDSIAEVLSSLDDKIDLLHRQNKTLEALAETLFRHTFIDNAQDDWDSYRVSDIAQHVKKGRNPSKEPEVVFSHYSLPAYDAGRRPIIEAGSEIRSNKYKVPPNSVLVSKLNPRFPRIWYIGRDLPKNPICSTEFQIFRPISDSYLGFLRFLFTSDPAKDSLTMSASGTSGSHQRVRPDDMLALEFMSPSLDLVAEYSTRVQSLLDKIEHNYQEIISLEQTRDTLLPKLMSGEIRVQYDEVASDTEAA